MLSFGDVHIPGWDIFHMSMSRHNIQIPERPFVLSILGTENPTEETTMNGMISFESRYIV